MHAHDHRQDHLATDPVCGMKVARGGSASVVHGGTTYWFCEPACAATFRQDPDRWATSEPLTHDHADHDRAGHAHHG